MSYKRVSRYYPGCDGTKIAVDIYIPDTEEKVPVLFQCANVGRRPEGPMAQHNLENYEYFVDKGYAVCIIERRGVGASQGVSEGFFQRQDPGDLKAVIDAVCSEDWCTGKGGMFGGSNVGMSQHQALISQPERLQCVIPCDCSADLYYQNYPNGVSILPEVRRVAMPPRLGTPVDDDPAPDFPEAHKALEHQKMNMPFLSQYVPNAHRDDVNPAIGYAPNMEIPAWSYMDKIRHGHVTTYLNGSWFDPGCTNAVFAYKSWGGKLLLGPWRHCEMYRPGCGFNEGDVDWRADHLKFFDWQLKGVQGDCSDEPPVRYYVMGDETPWHYAADFPLDSQTNPSLALTADGGLLDGKTEAGVINYRVRNDISIYDSMGRLNRRIDGDMAAEDEKCLCFTTEPLEKDVEITGFPVAELYVTSTAKDGIFFAFLQEVMPDGQCRFITDGMCRGRSAVTVPNGVTDSVGVPYHPSRRQDDVELSADKPTRLAFHLEVTSRIIKAGSRIRLAVCCGGSGFAQPDGVTEDTVVSFHFGGKCPAELRLPVIAPNVTRFTAENGDELYAFKRAVYLHSGDSWKAFPCLQVYPCGDELRFVTESFTAVRRIEGSTATITTEGALSFTGTGELPDRLTFSEKSFEIRKTAPTARLRMPARPQPQAAFRNLYIATVPCRKEQPGQMNPQPVSTLDLYCDVCLPAGEGPFPCIVDIHGFGGSHHQFDPMTAELLERGYAVASIDYRLMPPNVWPSSSVDAKGAIRYLKAHAKELNLDPARFGVMGCSMGGHLSTMIAACNGEKTSEGDIGGNTEFDSSVKAAVSPFPVTDFFTFGDDCAESWPGQTDRVLNGDGAYAPLASMLGYVGNGRGMADVKRHLFDNDEKYRELVALAKDASSVYHVTENSAPVCFIHGIFDYGVQVPMGQSLAMFEALTRKGVKSLVLLNNCGPYGEDPEVHRAALDFLTNRV